MTIVGQGPARRPPHLSACPTNCLVVDQYTALQLLAIGFTTTIKPYKNLKLDFDKTEFFFLVPMLLAHQIKMFPK